MKGTWLPGMEVHRRSVLDELWKAEREAPDRPLLRWREGDCSVGQLADAVRRSARGIRAMGVQPGDRVAVVAGNSPHLVALWYGIHAAGAVEVSVNYELRGQMLRHVLDDAEPALVLVEEAYEDNVLRAGAQVTNVVRFDEALREKWDGAEDIELADPEPGDLATLVYTSGTTGPSKGVKLSHGYFPNCGQTWRFGAGVEEGDVLYMSLPMFHADAHVLLPACLTSGTVFALAPRFSSSRFWEDVRVFGATWALAVGSVLDALINLGPPPERENLTLKRFIAAPISPVAYEFFEDELGIPLYEVYGQTEGDASCFGTPGRKRRGSAGWPCVGYDIAIIGPDGLELPPDETGELVYRPGAPHMVLSGYWRNDAATVATFKDLWFHTGDLASFDADGFLWFRGRMKDMLRRRGENISAFELELVINAFPGIRSSAAVAVPDDLGGEDEVKVFVSLHDGQDLDPDAFFALCEENLPRFAVPRFVEVVDEAVFVRSVGNATIQKHLLSDQHGPTVVDRETR